MSGIVQGLIATFGSSDFTFTISTNQTNANLRTLAINAGWGGNAKVKCTINSGIIVSSNSTATPGLTVDGSFPNGVELINNGTIAGMGGAGGNGAYRTGAAPGTVVNATAGGNGGTALAVSVALTLDNVGTIAGGGGGGGGGGTSYTNDYSAGDLYWGGGGGGGGRTGSTNSSGGTGGVPTATGTNYAGNNGTAGTSSAAGTGGINPVPYGDTNVGVTGGNGGGWGSAGSAGSNGTFPGSGAASGGSAGAAITGNSNITYISTGTRLGAVT